MATTFTTSNTIFCGLVAGYQGDNCSATPKNAAEAVKAALNALGAEGVTVRPAVCVYHTDWGCPQGGEPVGAFMLQGDPEGLLKLANRLRVALKQSTLSVALKGFGTETVGFTAEVEGDILEVGAKWQDAAAKQFVAIGTYVSCGIEERGDKVLISAEANPEFVKDLEAWQQVVKTICAELGTEPEFAQVGFNYLCD